MIEKTTQNDLLPLNVVAQLVPSYCSIPDSKSIKNFKGEKVGAIYHNLATSGA